MFLSMLRIQYPLYSPEAAAPPATAPTGDLSKDEILDYLNKDDEAPEDDIIPLDDKKDKGKDKDKDKGPKEKEDREEVEEEEETPDPLAELEEEIGDPSEEQLELTTPASRREILKKYPKIFKDFPHLEKAYYREQEFTKLLPTIADAKEAVEHSKTLQSFEADLVKGNTKEILQHIHTKDKRAFNLIVDNYLDTLADVDEKSYLHVLGNVVRGTIRNMVATARADNNEVLEQAAVILNQWAFGNSQFEAPKKLSEDTKARPEVDDREKELADREKKILQQKYNEVNTEITTKVNKAFKLTIENRIDPKNTMPEYVKRAAVRDALENLESLIGKDSRFKTLVDKLWEHGFKNNFDSTSTGRIKQAFVSKAQALLPAVIAKARNEALKGIGKRVRDDDSHQENESKDDEPRRKTGSNKGEESRPRNDSSSKNKVPDGMTALEYLMSDET